MATKTKKTTSKPAPKASAKKAPAKAARQVPAKASAKPAAPAKKAAKKQPEKAPALAKKAPAAPVKRVPPKIIKRVPPPPPPAVKPPTAEATASAVAFAMSIAEEMKRSARNEELRRVEHEIKLSRRPTTRAQGKNTVKFPEADLREFRRKLIDAREKALSGADAMKETGFNESDDREADGGDGTNQTLRLQALGQVGAINRTIQQIEEALHRIDDGTYGVCTVCGQLIRKPRLLNQPFVLTCMECQSEMERSRV